MRNFQDFFSISKQVVCFYFSVCWNAPFVVRENMRQVLPYSTRLCFQNGFEKIYCFCFLFHTLFFNILLLLKVLTLERYSEKQKFKSKF